MLCLTWEFHKALLRIQMRTPHPQLVMEIAESSEIALSILCN